MGRVFSRSRGVSVRRSECATVLKSYHKFNGIFISEFGERLNGCLAKRHFYMKIYFSDLAMVELA